MITYRIVYVRGQPHYVVLLDGREVATCDYSDADLRETIREIENEKRD